MTEAKDTDFDEDISVSYEEALKMLDIQDGMVHTFLNGGGMILGADWDLEAVKELMKLGEVVRTGDMASSMGHGLAVERADGKPVFLATKEEQDA